MTTINTFLTDADLAQTFKRLPPFDRLRVPEVCRRWYFLSQEPWREVVRLELDSSVPSMRIGPIMRMCPNLNSLFCKDKNLILDYLRDITVASLKSVEYHNCSFISHDHSANKTALPLFRSEYGQSMEELILHEHYFGSETALSQRYSQRLLPVSIKRLQLSGLNKVSADLRPYFIELANLRFLECLLVESKTGYFSTFGHTLKALASFNGLRELILPSDGNSYCIPEYAVESLTNLPKLEILVLPEKMPQPHPLQDSILLRSLFVNQPTLFTKHPTLRVLVIPGNIEWREPEIQVPIRKRFPHGFAADPLPLLHVFVGKSAAKLFRFDDSPANWLRVHPINAPFPELLEREEIAEIFGDSWVAKQIKEGAKRGLNFWRYGDNLMK